MSAKIIKRDKSFITLQVTVKLEQSMLKSEESMYPNSKFGGRVV